MSTKSVNNWKLGSKSKIINLDADCMDSLVLNPVTIHQVIKQVVTDQTLADTLFWQLAGEPTQVIWYKWQSQRRSWQEHAVALFKTYTRPTWDNFWRESSPTGWFWSSYYWSDKARQDALNNPYSLLKLAAKPYFLPIISKLYLKNLSIFSKVSLLLKALVDELLADTSERTGLLTHLQLLAWEVKTTNPLNAEASLDLGKALTLIPKKHLELARAVCLVSMHNQTIRFSHPLFLDFFIATSFQEQRAQGLQAIKLWPKSSWWEDSGWETAVSLALDYATDPNDLLAWLTSVQPVLAYKLAKRTNLGAETFFLPYQEGWQQAITDIEHYPHPHERQALGLLLADLDWDHRFGIGLDAQGLPALAWIEVPAGEFIYQDEERLDLASYQISRYLITNLQYQSFVQAADGYQDERWWQQLFKPDEEASLDWKEANRPAASITAYEALAFCRWLSYKTKLAIHLPTEQQWEKAARGTEARLYPWGNSYQSGAANFLENARYVAQVMGVNALEASSVVGIYPQGQSPYGVLDMAGNLAEWCLSQDTDSSAFSQDMHAGFVQRGGSCFDEPNQVVLTTRVVTNEPHEAGSDVGFRVCCSKPR